ncbi:MAG: prenyltransferase [Dehalococcoidales bacterium]|nr:prenyltransferase [Dehalococcoidales bacterium]
MKKWLLIIRAPFLPLSVILAFLGASIAWYDGFFHVGHALLAGLGILLGHISVDVLNEYFDYKSGIDFNTDRTMFNGGSGALPLGLLSSRQALWLGLVTFFLLIPIGVYFVLTIGWALLPLLLVAAFCIIAYSPVILKSVWPEWAPGLGIGAIPILGMYFVMTGEYNVHVLVASIPSFILVHNLLFLNEFPDAKADAGAGRKTTPITWGKKNSAIFYAIMTILVYVAIVIGVLTGQMPVLTLIALLTVPLAVKAVRSSMFFDDKSRFIPAMATNVQIVLVTQLLLGIGYVLSRVFGTGLLWQ